MEQTKLDTITTFARTIEWTTQACVRFTYNGHRIIVDPYKIESAEHFDLVLITHDHGDHLSLEDLAKVANTNTDIVAAEACVEKLKAAGYKHIRSVVPGSKLTMMGVDIEAVHAYNITKNFHPQEKKYVGYIFNFGGIRVYHTSDTGLIPEMKETNCDIIILPLGQTYTMDSVEDAVTAVLDSKASVAIPIHYGLYEGTQEDVEKFTQMLTKNGVTVVIAKK